MIAATPAPVRVSIDDLLVVSTTINGKGPYHFILDTGAGICVLTPEFAARAGIKGDGNTTATGTGKPVSIQTVTLDEMRVGQAAVQHVSAAIIPLPLDLTYQGDYGTIDGIVGFTFLSHFATTLNLADHYVVFTDPDAYASASESTRVAADLSGGTPVVDGTADGIAGKFQLDTGSNGWVDLTTSFVRRNDLGTRYRNGIPAMSQGVGGAVHATTIRLTNFALGGSTIPNEVASLSQATNGFLAGGALDGNIGTQVLRRFTFTVDYAHNHVDFTPRNDVAAREPYRSTGVLMTRRADGTFRVVAVAAGSPAAHAGIVADDTIVAIDGRSASHLDAVAVLKAVRAPAVRFTIRARVATREVELKPQEL